MKRKSKYRLCQSVFPCDSLSFLLLAFVCFICILSSDFLSAKKSDVKIEETRTAIEKWVETQRIISQEKRDLALAREMLTERTELLQREIESLHEKIRETNESIAEVDKKRVGLVEENEILKKASASVHDTITMIEKRTKELLPRLPDSLQERVKPLSQRLPENPEQIELSVAERFQNVVGILNEVNKFHREVTVTSERRTLPDGTSAEVTALYIGISQAYYTGANGTIAGIGSPSPQGWVWKPANEAAVPIAQAIAILKNEQVASFVQLPIEIH